jgi:hypothetical protein
MMGEIDRCCQGSCVDAMKRKASGGLRKRLSRGSRLDLSSIETVGLEELEQP